MKKLSIIGAILFTMGVLVATGIEVNPWQAVYALALLGASLVCFTYADRSEGEHTSKSEELSVKSEELNKAA